MAQRGPVFGVAEPVFHLGAVAVPVLDLRGRGAGGHVEVGDDERVGVDGVGELGQGQRSLIRVQGSAASGPRIAGDLAVVEVEPNAPDQQPGRCGPPVRAVVGDRDLRAGHVDRVGPAVGGYGVEQPPQRSDPPGPDRELDIVEQGGAGELPGEVAGVSALPDPPVRAAAGSAAGARPSNATAVPGGSSRPPPRSAATTTEASAQVATCGRPTRWP